MPKRMTTGQLAQHLGCTKQTIKRWCVKGMPHSRRNVPRSRRVIDYDVALLWLDRHLDIADYIPQARRQIQRDLGRSPSPHTWVPPRRDRPPRDDAMHKAVPDWHTAARAVAQAVRDRAEATHGTAEHRTP